MISNAECVGSPRSNTGDPYVRKLIRVSARAGEGKYMKTKGRLFWTRLLTMMALCIAALIAGLSFGMTSAYAENTDKAASSEDGGVSVLALPENVTVTGITDVELTGTVTTASSYAEIKAALAVTATGSDGETYELDPDEFEVVGVFEDGAIETNTFRIVCGTVTSEVTFEMSGEPVRNRRAAHAIPGWADAAL